MTDNEKNQTVQNNQNGNPDKKDPNNQNKNGVPSEKSEIKEDQPIKPVVAEDSKEHEDRKHPHETSVPVGSKNETKSGL
jgi:hypothetical protein